MNNNKQTLINEVHNIEFDQIIFSNDSALNIINTK